MPSHHRVGLLRLALATVLGLSVDVRGDAVTLKNGTVYRGADVDVDDTLVTIFDGVTRIVFRDTKVAKISTEAEPNLEAFKLDQPLDVHGGAMPAYAIAIKATPWDSLGRRRFEYIGPRSSKPVRMTQALSELGPKTSRLRGVDGFWVGLTPTSQVPKEVVLGLLARVDQTNLDARLRVNRFLIQAEWYPEALTELERLVKDFPNQVDTVRLVRQSVLELQANRLWDEVQVRLRAQQPREARSRLRTFPIVGAPTTIVNDVREALRRLDAESVEDQALADGLRSTAEALPDEARKGARERLVEMLAGLSEAPDAVRGRLEPFRKALADPALSPQSGFALALSGWVAGAEGAVTDPESAEVLWQARDLLQHYLAGDASTDRPTLAASLGALEVADPASQSTRKLDHEWLTRIVRQMPPPLRDADDEAPGAVKLLRIRDEPNPDAPTEYAVLLPPEYHPSRSYPAVVALHRGDGPETAVSWWASEAARRGYIVIAPEYQLRGQARDYLYTASEHAAVELALRDARRRFAVDSNRVFLGGQLLGANMAWDFALAHPDLFAGAAVVSGLPAKYVWAYKANAKRVPLFLAMGDLAPAESTIIFDLGKLLIARNYDVTYVEHYRRGLEDLPEDVPMIFDWMDRRRRDPYPKEIEVATARQGDDRFYGLVVREFQPRRSLAPELVDPQGKNLKPATLGLQVKGSGSLLLVTAAGVRRLDVWVSPAQIDLTKKFEVRVNGKTAYKGLPKPDLLPYLEDLRIRGDRQQVYAMKVAVNLGGGRP